MRTVTYWRNIRQTVHHVGHCVCKRGTAPCPPADSPSWTCPPRPTRPAATRAAFAGNPHLHTKLVRYPGRAPDGSEQGVCWHKDYGFLTLLLQDHNGGLQVRPPAPSPDAPAPAAQGLRARAS